MDQADRSADVSDDLLGGRLAAPAEAAIAPASTPRCWPPPATRRPGERVLEAGCGVGAALLAAARRGGPARASPALERDAARSALARGKYRPQRPRRSGRGARRRRGAPVRAPGLAPVRRGRSPIRRSSTTRTALRGPHPAKRGAWIADDGLAAWIDFLLKAVREGGAITLIHRADRLGDILGASAPKAGSFRVRPIQPFADAPAKRVLVRAIKTGKAPLVLLPALVLHDRAEAKHTAEAEAILRGEAALTGASSSPGRPACSWRSRASWRAAARRLPRSGARRCGGGWR